MSDKDCVKVTTQSFSDIFFNTEHIVSNKGQLLQDPFLNLLRREHVPVSIYLVNGIKPVSYTHLRAHET